MSRKNGLRPLYCASEKQLVADRLALGTVQFGLDYGIRRGGQVGPENVKSILREANAAGMRVLDTAIAYGESESVLGCSDLNEWSVVTKVPAVPQGCMDIAAWICDQVRGSLSRLGIPQLYGVLLHRPKQLLGHQGKQLRGALEELKNLGMTKKIGISIYGSEELVGEMGESQFDLVQAPLNILDRQLLTSGWVDRLKSRGTELHVRSVFLQGLLLMPPHQRPQQFARWHPVWAEWSRWLAETGLTPLQACLGYVLSVKDIDKVVVGVDSLLQLKEVLAASHSVLPSLPSWPQAIDADLIHPGHWRHL